MTRRELKQVIMAVALPLFLLPAFPLDGDSSARIGKLPDPVFGERETRGLVQYDPIDEASGLVFSRRNEGVLWTHNDSGDLPRLYAMDEHGRHLGVYTILGAAAVDWEDIAVGPGPEQGASYIYIGDYGDNKAKRDIKTIYRLPEPIVRHDQKPIDSALAGMIPLHFRYRDGMRDAETLIVDPLTGDIIIVSKREKQLRIYLWPAPQMSGEVAELEQVGSLFLSKVNGGDISADGREILLKTYDYIYYWKRDPGESVWQALEREPLKVTYSPEVQGESVAWDRDARGYFTISEEKNRIPAFLFYYPRLDK
jgi:hypothetical protein